jgi:hypothetical protein
MNGLAQLIRALVMESLALVLLFSFAFGRLQQPEAPDSTAAESTQSARLAHDSPSSARSSKLPRLSIVSAPRRARRLTTQSAALIGRKFGAAARSGYETAFRIERRSNTSSAAPWTPLRPPSKSIAIRR